MKKVTTIEQMEFILDKRMAIFEQVLNLQVVHLHVSSRFTPEHHHPVLAYTVKLIASRIYMIKSIKPPKFPGGGIMAGKPQIDTIEGRYCVSKNLIHQSSDLIKHINNGN